MTLVAELEPNTAVGACSDETVVDFPRTEAAPELAWSESSWDEPVPQRRWPWAVLAVAGSALLATLIWAVVAFSNSPGPPQAQPRSAVQDDKAFMDMLDARGVVLGNPGAARVIGRKACVTLDGGTTRSAMVAELMGETGLSARDAGQFLAASAAVYCPRYVDVVREEP